MTRDVVWITLESVRQDRTSLGRDDRDTTPNLRELARRTDAAAFSNCFSHDVWTRPSSASILTGLPSSAHRTWSQGARLSGDIPTVPEAFREAGYRTVCVSPNAQLSPGTGLDRGFDRFRYLNRKTLYDEVGLAGVLRYAANIREHSGGFSLDIRKHSLGYPTQMLAKRHVEEAAADGKPLFLYAHIGDSHHPYHPPKPWRDRFVDDVSPSLSEALDVALDMSDNLHERIGQGVPYADEEMAALRAMYDAGLSHVDSLMAGLVASAEAHLDDPLIVVTGDHGELFGERDLLAHMLVTDDAVSNVPLVVLGVDGLAGDRDGLVQHADAMETVVSAAGVDADVPAGVDLRDADREFVVTQRGGPHLDEKLELIRERVPGYDGSRYGAGDMTSVRTDAHRYQRSDAGEELFELADESRDVSSANPDLVGELRETCDAWLREHGSARSETEERSEFDASMEAQLRDLGYL
jgi:arylsulfatase A-like enzyme